MFQDTAVLGAERHPMHLHGFSFYVVGQGFGNFDKDKDPITYNMVDPPYQNTVSVPAGGWAAMRFRAANPGEYFAIYKFGQQRTTVLHYIVHICCYMKFFLMLCCFSLFIIRCVVYALSLRSSHGVGHGHCVHCEKWQDLKVSNDATSS